MKSGLFWELCKFCEWVRCKFGQEIAAEVIGDEESVHSLYVELVIPTEKHHIHQLEINTEADHYGLANVGSFEEGDPAMAHEIFHLKPAGV